MTVVVNLKGLELPGIWHRYDVELDDDNEVIRVSREEGLIEIDQSKLTFMHYSFIDDVIEEYEAERRLDIDTVFDTSMPFYE